MTRPLWGAVLAVFTAWCLAVTLQAARAASEPPATAEAAPARLSDTGLYVEGTSEVVDPRNRPFVPQYPLWTDGLEKRRWVFLPEGATIDAADEHAWAFPVGTRFWKEFSRDGRKVETRFLWRTASGWVFASYAWNDDGTDAVLAPEEGIYDAAELAPGRTHTIPARADCAACHGDVRPSPLGFSSLQLSPDRDPGAVHGEPLRPGMLTLRELVDEGWLRSARADLVTDPPRIRTDDPDTRAVLGYLAANCGVCHDGKGDIAAFGPTIRVRDLVADGDAAAHGLIGQRTKWQIPGVPDGESVLVEPGAPERSAMAVRMRSRQPSSQMPPLGTVLRDEKALDLIERWIRYGREGSTSEVSPRAK